MIKHLPPIISLSDWPDLIFFKLTGFGEKLGGGKKKNMKSVKNFLFCGVGAAQGKPGERDFFEKIRENLGNSGNSLTIFTTSRKTQGILLCQTSLIK